MTAFRIVFATLFFVTCLGGCATGGSSAYRSSSASAQSRPQTQDPATAQAEAKKRREIEELHRSIKNRTGG